MFKAVTSKSEKEWKQIRTKVITATESYTVLGLNRFKSVKEMLEEKANPTFKGNAYTWLGQQLEPIVVSATNEVLGSSFKLYEENEGIKTFYVDIDLGLGATPDAHDDIRLLECKSTKPRNFLRWGNNAPVNYLCQLYVQLLCTDKQEGLLSILSTNLTQNSEDLNIPINIFELHRTDEIDNIILSEIKRFWETQNKNKLYRVNRKLSKELELRLKFNSRRIYSC